MMKKLGLQYLIKLIFMLVFSNPHKIGRKFYFICLLKSTKNQKPYFTSFLSKYC